MGISTKHKIVPNILFNRAIQFNSPFSRILYDSFISENLRKFFIKYNIKQNTKREKKAKIFREIYNAYLNSNSISEHKRCLIAGSKGEEYF